MQYLDCKHAQRQLAVRWVKTKIEKDVLPLTVLVYDTPTLLDLEDLARDKGYTKKVTYTDPSPHHQIHAEIILQEKE